MKLENLIYQWNRRTGSSSETGELDIQVLNRWTRYTRFGSTGEVDLPMKLENETFKFWTGELDILALDLLMKLEKLI